MLASQTARRWIYYLYFISIYMYISIVFNLTGQYGLWQEMMRGERSWGLGNDLGLGLNPGPSIYGMNTTASCSTAPPLPPLLKPLFCSAPGLLEMSLFLAGGLHQSCWRPPPCSCSRSLWLLVLFERNSHKLINYLLKSVSHGPPEVCCAFWYYLFALISLVSPIQMSNAIKWWMASLLSTFFLCQEHSFQLGGLIQWEYLHDFGLWEKHLVQGPTLCVCLCQSICLSVCLSCTVHSLAVSNTSIIICFPRTLTALRPQSMNLLAFAYLGSALSLSLSFSHTHTHAHTHSKENGGDQYISNLYKRKHQVYCSKTRT